MSYIKDNIRVEINSNPKRNNRRQYHKPHIEPTLYIEPALYVEPVNELPFTITPTMLKLCKYSAIIGAIMGIISAIFEH